MPLVKQFGIKNPSTGNYDMRDIGAEAQNIAVSYDSSGTVIEDINAQGVIIDHTKDKSAAKAIKDIEEQLKNNTNATITDTEPYTYRTSQGNLADMDLVGATVAWNQYIRETTTSYWEAYNSRYGSVTGSNDIIIFTLTEAMSEASYRQGISLKNSYKFTIKAGHKYFGTYTVNPSVACTFKDLLLTSSGLHPTSCNANEWNIVSFINEAPSDKDTAFVVYPANYLAVNDTYQLKNVMVIDLTQLFGSAVADAIYAMETAEAGAGVVFFRKYFPKDYYAYNAGSLQSVCVGSRKVTENLLPMTVDGLKEMNTTGTWNGNAYTTYGITFTILTDVCGNVTGINVNGTNSGSTSNMMLFNDATNSCPYNGYTLKGCPSGGGSDTYNIRISDVSTGYNSDYGDGVTINVPLTGRWRVNIRVAANMQVTNKVFRPMIYQPGGEIVYPFGNIALRGLFSIVNGKLRAAGDVYKANGSEERKYWVVDLGTLTWNVQSETVSGIFKSSLSSRAFGDGNFNMICPKYVTYTGAHSTSTNIESLVQANGNGLYVNGSSGAFFIADSAYTDAATFKAAMSGVMLVYELATPTIISVQPFQNPQRSYIGGTEEFTDGATRDVMIPVGNDTTYSFNTVLPDAEDYADGVAGVLEKQIDIKADISALAPSESGVTASKSYAIGEHFYKDGKFCTVISDIASGATLTKDTNYVEGTVAGSIDKITQTNTYLIGTGTAGQDKGSGATNRYVPTRWTFNTGITPSTGDVIITKVPVAGGSYGVYISIDNGATYKPVAISGTTRLQAQYGVGVTLQLVYESNSSCTCYALEGSDSTSSVTGIWRVLNYYDSNTTYSKMSQSEANTGTATDARTMTAAVLATTIANKITGKADKVTSATAGDVATLDANGNIVDSGKVLGTAATKNSTNAVTANSTDLVESGAVKTAIDTAVSSSYHHAGTKTVAQLTSSLLIASNEGNVYNITDSGTTTADFIEGAGKTIRVGDNVGVAKVGSSYKFDLLSGFIDVSNKADKVSGATNGNIAALDSSGNLTDSGKTLGKSVPSNAVFTDTTYSMTNEDASIKLTPSVGEAQNVELNALINGLPRATGDPSDNTNYITQNNDSTKTTYFRRPASALWNYIKGKIGIGSGSTFLKKDGTWATPTDTKNTAGSTDSSSKLFLIGATSQAANPQTYSHDTAYVGTDGCLYSGGTKVLTTHQDITGKVDKVSGATAGNVATLDANGNLVDSGKTLDKSVPSNAVFTDTKNTAGSTDSSSKLFLIGATSQATNPQTYSQDTAYVGTDGCLYSGGTKVLTAHQDITGKADKVTSATNGDVATLDANGNLVDSGKTLGVSVPSDAKFTDTNTKATQTNTTGSADYRILLSANANDSSETNTTRKSTNFTANPSTGVMTAKKFSGIALNEYLTGTGTAGQDKGSGVTNRYVPSKWTFNTGITHADGDIITIKVPVAGISYGVYLSTDNGTTYKPVAINGSSRLQTQYGVGATVQLVYESASSCTTYALEGSDATLSVTGIWRVLNYYNSDTTYSKMSQSEADTGTATTARTMTAAVLATTIDNKIQGIVTSQTTVSDGWVDSHLYEVGDYCIVGSTLYKCLYEHTSDTNNKPPYAYYWDATKVCDELKSLNDPIYLGKWSASPSDFPYDSENRFPSKSINVDIDISQYKKLSVCLLADAKYSGDNHINFDEGAYTERNLNEFFDMRDDKINGLYSAISTPMYHMISANSGMAFTIGWMHGRVYISPSAKKIINIQFLCRDLTYAIASNYISFSIIVYGYK